MAVDHALQNALYRGNLEIDSEQNIQGFGTASLEDLPQFVQERFEQEPYKNRLTNVVIEIKSNGFAIRVRDEGPGFDTSELDDWNELSFRGTNLMKAFMDSVQYNDQGNEVKMVYRFDRSKIRKKPTHRAPSRPAGRLICQVTGEIYEINDRKFVIGRRSACHLKLQGANVAPLHCMLVNDEDQVMLLNLSPEYETLVNGKAGNGSQLKKGDLIRVGDHTFMFETNASQ